MSSLEERACALLGGVRAPDRLMLARRDGTGPAPLSYAQQAMWFLDRWRPGLTAYNEPSVYRIRGPVEPAVLARCLRRIAGRHQLLRTVFRAEGDHPVQLATEAAPELMVENLHAPGGPERDAGLAVAIDLAANRPFDLAAGPPLRAVLIRLAHDEAVLVVTFHHICWDGVSQQLFDRELTTCYEAELAAAEPALPPLPVQYADYAAWQRAAVADGRLAGQLEYWQRQLAGAPEDLGLLADRARPASRSFAGRTVAFTVDPDLVPLVRTLAADAGATPYMVLLAAFGVLLHRYTGRSDLVVGTPAVTRDQPELEHLIGPLVTTLPLRLAVPPEAGFGALLASVRDTVVDALAHRDVPFELLVERLCRGHTLESPPLAQVIFGLHPPDRRELKLGPATATRELSPTGTAKFDLTWSVFDDAAGGLHGEVEYDVDRYSAATVDRMISHWLTLLAGAVRQPDTAVARLPILTPADRAVVAPRAPLPVQRLRPLHRLFEEVADRQRGRTAVVHGSAAVTYGDLDTAGDRVAARLRAAGVRSGDRVALLAAPGPDLLAAVLGVLKAGGCYVPVDPQNPAERQAWLLADAGVCAVLTDDPEAVPVGPWAALALSAPSTGLAPRLDLRVDPRQPAYVIYTSGSTGVPKGVAVPHANVTALLAATQDRFGWTAADVWTLFHSLAFDFSVWEMWAALLHGARLVVVPTQTRRDPAAFARLLAAERVTVLNQTPSAFASLVGALEDEPHALALRWIVFGGAALEPHLVRRWFTTPIAAGVRLCNMYGITETTVHVTAYDIEPGGAFPRSVIGSALPHLSVAVLDSHGQPMPNKVPGEVHVGGLGVADGYPGRPGLTASRFRPDPAGRGTRRYRSGDLARWLPDGTLEYLGRLDAQVKVRGHRVEPGEVEATLAAHPAVRGCAVVADTDDGGTRLIGYAVAAGVDAAELRRFIANRLPEYMVPAVVVLLDRLPLTASGKLDRAALAAPTVDRGDTVAGHMAPRSPAERLLAEAWQAVLGVDMVGANDNFFELGGDSVRAVMVAGRLQARGLRLEIESLFRHRRLGAVAATLAPAGQTAEPAAFALVPDIDRDRLPAGLDDAYPMTAMQLAMLYHQELDPVRRPYHNINSYHVRGPLDTAAFRQAVTEAVSRHPVLRTCFDLTSCSEPMQLVHTSVPVPLTVHDLTGRTEADQDQAVRIAVAAERAALFDPNVPPLFRITLHRLAPNRFQFTVAEHHAIVDGWSFTSLVAEILRRHTLLRRNPAAAPPDPPTSTFRAFVAAERAAADDLSALAYWRHTLTGVDGAMFPAPAEPAPVRVSEHLLPADLCVRMRELAQGRGVGAKTVALAAHILALAAVTGRTAITTGMTTNGRLPHAGGTEALGLFLNTVPVHLELGDGGDWLSLLDRLHRVEVELMPHRRLPYARLVRLMRGRPLDVNFVYNRFHALRGLAQAGAGLSDGGLGIMPTHRAEPDYFALVAAFIQDPGSPRTLLAVSADPKVLVPSATAGYVERCLALLEAMTADPHSRYPLPIATSGATR